MQSEFIKGLDGYFAETYENYDKLCRLKGYEMPKLQDTKILENGHTYAYTLPRNVMRLSLQQNKEKILEELKRTFKESDFSFSFRPLSAWEKFKDTFYGFAFRKVLPPILAKNKTDKHLVFSSLSIDEGVWNRILKGTYYPTKTLLFSIVLAVGLSPEDTDALMSSCGFVYELDSVRDVVVKYLVEKRIVNSELVFSALDEYKVGALFLKRG